MHAEPYVVVPVGDGWVVIHNGRVSGMFSSRETAAVSAKIRAAYETAGPADDPPSVTAVQT